MTANKLPDEVLEEYGRLTTIEQRFVQCRLKGYSMAKSVNTAYPKPVPNPNHRGNTMLGSPRIVRFFRTLSKHTLNGMSMEYVEIANKLTNIIETDVFDVLDVLDGNTVMIKSMDAIPESARCAIKSIENTKYGLKVVMYDKISAIKQLIEMRANVLDSNDVKEADKMPQGLNDFYNQTMATH